jgi:hypothetical protein
MAAFYIDNDSERKEERLIAAYASSIAACAGLRKLLPANGNGWKPLERYGIEGVASYRATTSIVPNNRFVSGHDFKSCRSRLIAKWAL